MNRHIGKILFSLIFIAVGILSITIAVLAMNLNAETAVRPQVTIEAGEGVPSAQAFLTEEYARRAMKAFYVTDMSFIDPENPVLGSFAVELTVSKKNYFSALVVADTRPPQGKALERLVVVNEVIDPALFVSDISDATKVTVTYDAGPDFTLPGLVPVWLCLTDEGFNRTILSGKALVIEGARTLEIELGSPPESGAVALEDFVYDEDVRAITELFTDLSEISVTTPGLTPVYAAVDGFETVFYVNVSDTTPPAAEALEVWAYRGVPLEAWRFVANIQDESPVAVSFKNEPDWSQCGVFPLVITLEDAFGNMSEVLSTLTVREDTDPPEFFGLETRYVVAGGTVVYRKGVTAIDAKDGEVPFTVNAEFADILVEGTYPIYYEAVDEAGNVAEAVSYLVVTSVEPELVFAMAEEVLAGIIKEDMTAYQKGRVIYNWVRANVHYTSTGEKDSYIEGAYNAIKKGQGDCYTYYAISKLLLDLAGIPNVDLERIEAPNQTHHYWNLVNVGDGWYHFDTCPHKTAFDGYLFSESQARAYTAERGRNYYVYEEELLPEGVVPVWE